MAPPSRSAPTAATTDDSLTERIIGEHESIVQLRDLVERVARSKAGIVLIYGETGAGKGLVARALHARSSRAQRSFTEINCAAIPGNLMESELFGHERGAFTGAVQRKVGLLEIAAGGTLFLDEIRELDPVMQAKILTLFDSRRFRRIGAVQELSTDARFIAATNKILLGEVHAGRFRDDLYYRLQVVSINIPPLRDRGDDVFVLADRLLKKFNALHGSRFTELDPAVRDVFRQYRWPGNVRELSNLLERICILEEGRRVRLEHLPPRIVREARHLGTARPAEPLPLTLPAAVPAPSAPMPARAGVEAMAAPTDDRLPASGPRPGREPLEYFARTARFQAALVTEALRAHDGNQSRAAEALGLSRHALRHQMRKLGLLARKS